MGEFRFRLRRIGLHLDFAGLHVDGTQLPPPQKNAAGIEDRHDVICRDGFNGLNAAAAFEAFTRRGKSPRASNGLVFTFLQVQALGRLLVEFLREGRTVDVGGEPGIEGNQQDRREGDQRAD